MKTLNNRTFIMLAALLTLTLAACDLTKDEVAQTLESMPPSELAGLSATIEALPAAQVAALETAAAEAGVPTLSSAQVTAVVGTVEAARATATKVGEMVAQGERVNATQMPDQAPVIIYFFASVPTQRQAEEGIRYFLNWTTQNANRVEIFGYVMDNPLEGAWPVYHPSDDWVLWAANDRVWVEQFRHIEPDKDVGGNLQDVRVSNANITLTLRDPQFVDGDQIAVDVNGVRVINGYVTTGRRVSFPVTLQSGANTLTFNALSAGVTPPLVVEVSISAVTSGPAVQLSRGLNNGEAQSFTITAP